ncbi:Por secretion system C-terminal sorting domain-containing protein [Catalinimonas alkaloidigena]|uniref:Por secretion system C-terminal sorting domain-containing protein n=1 Tax=Catalinimonas alkaloidigena TaxID=1075417 RepID=A0A1G9IN72_9BACT|nr:T9SS type A sorting domain-containing protein [Catalinimonas alkaloidigena]SDL26334.1 Por secretion system C-terminal sorting domain-containing protein [Catalinimonas alkaloidigena]
MYTHLYPRVARPLLCCGLMFLSALLSLRAQTCEGDVTLSTQTQVNAFACSVVTGNLTIKSASAVADPITSLTKLTTLTRVVGNLNIQDNASLATLEGLNNLTTVSGNLSIAGNGSLNNLQALAKVMAVGGALDIGFNGVLTSLSGLSGIVSVGDYLNIRFNAALPNLQGLSALTTVGGYLSIYQNAALTSLTGLNKLTTVGSSLLVQSNPKLSECCVLKSVIEAAKGSVTIQNNAAGCSSVPDLMAACEAPSGCEGNVMLTTQAEVNAFACQAITGNLSIVTATGSADPIKTLKPLASLTSVSGDLYIGQNDALATLEGLQNLTTIGGGLALGNNDALPSLQGFRKLTSVGGALQIYYNDKLATLEGLNGLKTLGGALSITYNPQLSTCCVLQSVIAAAQSVVTIQNNATGCNSATEIATACTPDEPTPDVCDGTVVLATQADVNAFACKTVKGNLVIGIGDLANTTVSDITDLSPLASLTSVGGTLMIRATRLKTLAGLGQLTSVGVRLLIRENAVLESVAGLGGVRTIGEFLVIRENNVLNNLTALQGVTSISELHVFNNPALTSCCVLEEVIAATQGKVTIQNNAKGCNSVADIQKACAPASVQKIWLEAECAQVGSNWVTNTSVSASNGGYVTIAAGSNSLDVAPTALADRVRFTFTAQGGAYRIFARVAAPDPNDDSFWIRVNGGDWLKWNSLFGTTDWVWKEFGSSPFALVAGTNVIDVAYREDGALLDKLYLTTNNDRPAGIGGAAAACVADPTPVPPPTTSDLWFEAECAQVGSRWDTVPNLYASQGHYVTVRLPNYGHTPSDDPADQVSFAFNVAKADSFQFFVRVRSLGRGQNSFWVKVDGGSWALWNGWAPSYDFQWGQVLGRRFWLKAGAHTLTFAFREPNVRMDKVYITARNQVPVGLGEAADNCVEARLASSELLPNAKVFHLYPNPVHDRLTIETDVPAQIRLYNALGSQVLERRVTQRQVLDLSTLPAGVYFLKREGYAAERIVKQ